MKSQLPLCNAHALLKRSTTLCLLWGKRLDFGAFTRSFGINYWELTSEMFTGPSAPQCFCSLGGCCPEVIVASYFTALVIAAYRLNFCSFTVAAFGPRAVHWKSSSFPPFLLTLSS